MLQIVEALLRRLDGIALDLLDSIGQILSSTERLFNKCVDLHIILVIRVSQLSAQGLHILFGLLDTFELIFTTFHDQGQLGL